MVIKAQSPAPDQQQSANLPPGPEGLSFEAFQGINTSTSRPGVKTDEMAWSDGFLTIGPRMARTFPDIGTALYTAPGILTIAFFDFANIGSDPYCIVFLSDGSIVAVNTSTAIAATIAPAATITNPSRLTVGLSQYGSVYVLIVAKQADGYFIWDGTTFFAPGDPGPAGGTMPTGIGGTAIEIYAGRVWIADGAMITFSAPGNLIDFDSADGGGEFTSSDSFLRVRFVQLIQSNGFLYLIADSSVNYISNVQTSNADPPITTFTNQNADPEVGTPWPGTVDTFGRNILFANAFGAHVSYGAAVTKISEPLDGVYNTLDNFGGLIPSAAKAIVFGKKLWILLLPIIDPITGQQVSKMFAWNSKQWYPTSQSIALTYIQHQEIDSVLTAWGTTGTVIYPLFQAGSSNFTKIIQSRLWDTPIGMETVNATNRLWLMGQYFSLAAPNLTISIDNETNSAVNTVVAGPDELAWSNSFGAMTWTNANGVLTWYANGSGIFVLPPTAVGQQGVLLGMTIETNSPDFALIAAKIQPEVVQYRG